MLHVPGHLLLSVAAFAVTLGFRSLTVNRLVKRKLRLSLVLLVGSMAISLLLAVYPFLPVETVAELRAIQNLAIAAALINVSVLVAINPLRLDRVPDRFPAILQDFIVIGLVLVASTFFSDRLLTTSAVSAVVLGFALQDTLGNAFAGLAIQSEKPFHVGHWVRVGEFEGRVEEVTWRATKLRTKAGNFVILPNNLVSKEAITNFSEPDAPTRLEVSVGAAYQVAPNDVKAAILEALRNTSQVLATPPPYVELIAFDGSAITYKAKFWIDDYRRDDEARDEARTAIFYAFRRRNIEIPWPIQVEYRRTSRARIRKCACENRSARWPEWTCSPRCRRQSGTSSRRRARWPPTARARPSSARARPASRCSWCARERSRSCSNRRARKSRASSGAGISGRCRC